MTTEKLNRAIAFLEDWDIDCSGETILLSDRDNSVIMNPDDGHEEFGGYSIRAIAETVAEKLGKKVKYKQL